jgi:hypothetical protein
MYIKYSVDEKLLLLLGFSVAYLLAGASMFEQPGQANSQLISILAPFCLVPGELLKEEYVKSAHSIKDQ